jgi:hypothetical protein
MYFLYLDESGTENTSHFVLAGIAIQAMTWSEKTSKISQIKKKFRLSGKELHAGWMMRRYVEQEKIDRFEELDDNQRIKAVIEQRKATLLHIATHGTTAKLKTVKTNFKKTFHYVHLTQKERTSCLQEMADLIGSWSDCRLFAEAVDRKNYTVKEPIFDFAFRYLAGRYDAFLKNFSRSPDFDYHGLLIQDNNDKMASQLTELTKKFHKSGTLWNPETRIIETPLFVSSELTSMIQLADLIAYATRRFFENGETDLFDRFYPRFDRLPRGGPVVGIRHFTGSFECHCKVCMDHNQRL